MSIASADPMDAYDEAPSMDLDAVPETPTDKHIKCLSSVEYVSPLQLGGADPINQATETSSSATSESEGIVIGEAVCFSLGHSTSPLDVYSALDEAHHHRVSIADDWSLDASGADVAHGSIATSPAFPDATLAPNTESHLTDRVRLALEHLLRNLRRQSHHSFVTVREVRVEAFQSYEEDTTHVILYLKVDLPPEIAIDYWETLGGLIPYWSQDIDSPIRKIMNERIIVQVDWS